MYIKEKTEIKNISHGYLRNKLVKEIENSFNYRKGKNKEEAARKELLEKIKKGELGNSIPA